MTRIQLTNLISYWLLMTSNNTYKSSPDYISEKYDLFFNDVTSIDVIYDYTNIISSVFRQIINRDMDKWNIKIYDENFYKFYVTYKIIHSFSNSIPLLIERYYSLFENKNVLTKISLDNKIHPVLKNKLNDIISQNRIVFRNLFVKELLNKTHN